MDLPDFKETQFKLMDIFDNLPTWAGNAALNFFKDSWRRQGFVDTGFKAWPKRKHDAASSARNVLMKSGRLRRSLRLRVGQGWFEIYTDVPYAKAHNEGETIKQIVTARQRRFFWAMHSKAKKLGKGEEAGFWKSLALSQTLTIKMPKRQFMGPSRFLERRIVAHVERALENAIR